MARRVKHTTRSLAKVQANLNKAIAKKFARAKRGLIKAGIFILGESIRETPRDTSNLRASGYVLWNMVEEIRVAPKQPSSAKASRSDAAVQEANYSRRVAETAIPEIGKFRVEIGFVAYYAVFVHEGVDKNFRMGKAKFLSDPVHRNHKEILKIIQKEDKRGSARL